MMTGTATIGMLGENVRLAPDISFLAGMPSFLFRATPILRLNLISISSLIETEQV